MQAMQSIRARHRSIVDRIFWPFAPDFAPEESNELVRTIVKRAREIGLYEEHAVLDTHARLTYVQCVSGDAKSGMEITYLPPDNKLWDDPTYALEPAEIIVKLHSKTEEDPEAFRYLCNFVTRTV